MQIVTSIATMSNVFNISKKINYISLFTKLMTVVDQRDVA
jgi:hypothetical protein